MHLQRSQFVLITLLLLLTLVYRTMSQGGGGGGGGDGGGGDFSGGDFSGGGGGGGGGGDIGFAGLMMIIIFVIPSIIYCASFEVGEQRQMQQKIRIINQQMQLQRAKVNQFPSSLSQEQQQNIIDNFRSKKWTIKYQNRFDKRQVPSTFQLNSIESTVPYIYEFTAQSNDEVGPSHSTGLLTFQNNNLRIFFQKSYDDRIKAGQYNSYEVLIYDGAQQGENLNGRWYYLGHENEKKYSGIWIMNHK